MADDTLRELNEAVLPIRFSLDAQRKEEADQAKYRLSDEGFQPPGPLGNAIENHGIPLVQDDRTEFGLALGRRREKDDDGWTDEPNPPSKRGKSVGLYVNLKF